MFLWQMMKDVSKEQADRIFKSCDKAGDGRISLNEFRRVVRKGKKAEPQKEEQQQTPAQEKDISKGAIAKAKQWKVSRLS